MTKLISFFLLLLLTGCEYSITMVHTEGVAKDVVDENQTASPDVQASLNYGYRNGPSAPANWMPQPKNLTGPIGSN